ncbi:MAG: Crp/Fnr family transcriptional regulator [Flavobacteriaceae bacterium]|nr:Crp/Fnr family transcriptional regulator [Flavobacteriaceae bacterium]
MKNEITEFIKVPLSEEEQNILFSKFKPLRLNKGDYFVKTGEISKYLAFIIKGCMYCSYNKDGIEVVDEFSFEKDFIADYGNMLKSQPSDKDIKCLEDCELMVISFEDLKKIYDLGQTFEKIGRIITESLFLNWHDKSKSLLLDDAQERYLKLIKNKPNLQQRVPQYLIASYLGVSPETLSRVRRKITSEKNKNIS